jgi:hypothetical protein
MRSQAAGAMVIRRRLCNRQLILLKCKAPFY